MLIEFTVGNYRSFKDPVTFSMVAAKLTAKEKALDEHNVFPLTDKISLSKSCAIYGANASGKSNLVQAFRFMRYFVLNSSKDSQADEPIDIDRFQLSTETVGEPSLFEMVFYTEGKRYRYGFTVDTQKVHSEWTFSESNAKPYLNLFPSVWKTISKKDSSSSVSVLSINRSMLIGSSAWVSFEEFSTNWRMNPKAWIKLLLPLALAP